MGATLNTKQLFRHKKSTKGDSTLIEDQISKSEIATKRHLKWTHNLGIFLLDNG